MTGARFEIRIDGTPGSYRDRKDYAMEAARLIFNGSASCFPPLSLEPVANICILGATDSWHDAEAL